MTGPASIRIGIVGATGLVGRELLGLIEKRKFPLRELRLFASRARRRRVPFRGQSVPVGAAEIDPLLSCSLVFFASSDEVSARLAKTLADRGVWVIDDSSAFRLSPGVPLVIPEVNARALTRAARLISGPNCTMTGLAVAAHPFLQRYGIVQVRVASYQSVSGAGKEALEEFRGQSRSLAGRWGGDEVDFPRLSFPRASALPAAIASNVIPQVGPFGPAGYSGEEEKVTKELRKVWGLPRLAVSVTAVRVPVLRGHSLAAWITLKKPAPIEEAERLLKKAPGLKYLSLPSYPTPLAASGREPVFAGRLRRGIGAREICLWIVSDNLLKGAALNSIQIAEELLRRGWLGAEGPMRPQA